MESTFARSKIRPILRIRPGLFLVFLLVALGNFSLFGMAAAEAAEKEVLILHTNNVTGHLFPCPT